jgi:hypothetical protein
LSSLRFDSTQNRGSCQEKSEPGTFSIFHHKVFDGKAFRALPALARCAYFEFIRAYNGRNNGDLVMSARMMAELLGCGRTCAAEAIRQLVDARLIEMTGASVFGEKPLARTYRIIDRKCDISGMRAGWASNVG